MAGKVNVPITVGIQGLTKSVSQLNALGASLGKVGKTAGLAAIAYGTFAAGVKIGDFAVQAVAGARDLERNLAGLETVFDNLTPRMETFSKNATSMGLSRSEAAKASTFIGSVLKQSGFDIGQTADLTERLVGLATDLSITYGYDVQEALLGMTALFRGEYDPIEKFGVAMKQSEINAELAARGQDNLTGAARRFAEQQIRVELLFQRSQDAQGAYARQSGTLAVEQQRLAATFENVKDTVATSLLPVLANLMTELQGVMESVGPEIKQVFDELAPVIEDAGNVLIPAMVDGFMLFLETLGEIVDLLGQAFNPLTQLGESFAALGIQVESVFKTITGSQLSVEAVFDGIAWVINLVVNALHDLLYIIDNTIIGFKVMGEMVSALFTGDWNKLVNTDWSGQIEYQIKLKDAVNEQKLAVAGLNAEIANQETVLRKANKAWANSWIARGEWAKEQGLVPAVVTPTPTPETDKTVKKYVKSIFDTLKEETWKQSASLQLADMGASKGLVDLILGQDNWLELWSQIKNSTISLADLQKQFNATAAGAKELADATEEARQAWEKYDQEIADIEARLAEELKSIAEHFDDVRLSFSDLLAEFDTLPTYEREMGKFESAVTGYLSSIEDSLLSAFRNGDLLEEGYNDLRNYARAELALLQSIQRQRDEMATRYSLADALISEYRSAFTSAMNLTSLFDSLSKETQTRTVTEVSKGIVQLSGDLRTFNVTVSKSYEETLTSVSDKSQGLLEGFQQMAVKARAFADNLQKLKALGLDPMLFDQLVQAGVEAGSETAQALVDGGSDTINEINSLYQEIDALGADLGEQVAMTMYGTGIDMADGLLAGIKSKQAELEAQAITMAEAFNTAFQSKITTAVGAAQTAAEGAARAAADAAIAEVPVPEVPRPTVDTAALAELDKLIAKAGSYATNIGDATKAAGALVKQDIYQQLRDTVAAGGSVDLSGISSGLSSAELAQRAATASGGVVNNYTVNVTADTRTSGAKAGEAVVQAINNFQSANGSFTTYLK